MDPVSVSASVVTLLAAAGGSCKFLHAFVLDIADAPQDIRKQNEMLNCLTHTLTRLSQVCSEIPENFRFETPLHEWIARFSTEVSSTRDRIEVRAASLDHGRYIRRIQGSFRWVIFDRQLRKFYGSLEHWNIVFSQACNALQMELLLSIQKDMTSLATIHLEQKILCTPKASYHIAERASLAKRMKLVSLDRGLLAISSYEDDIREISKYLKARTVAKRTYPLADAAEQNLRMKPDHQLLCVKGNISVSIGSGSATTRYCFSDDQTQHNLKGYTGFIIFQDKGWMFRRFVFHFKFYYGDPCLPGLGTRFNLRFPRVIMPNSPWHQAVQNGDMPALKQWILSRKVSVSDVTVHGDTLLHVAVRHGQREVVDFLIQNHADVNTTNDWGETPLHASIQQAEDLKCTRLLLTAGADIFIEDAGGQTALHTFYSDVTRAIFQHCLNEIDLWTQDSQGMTSMHYFCWSSRAPADLVSRIQYEEHQFLTSQRPSCFELKDASGRSMLHFATQRGNLELMKLLLRHPRAQKLMEPDYYGRSLLHYAVETSQVGAIDMLLGHNLNLDVRDKEARTLLHHAAMKNSLEAVKHLLHLGVREQVKARDISNRTPLELALAYKSQKVVEYFRHSLIKEDMYDYGSLPMKKQLYSDEFRPPRWRDWIDARVLKTSPEFASLMLGFLTVLLIFLLWW